MLIDDCNVAQVLVFFFLPGDPIGVALALPRGLDFFQTAAYAITLHGIFST
jgi:hypothetical protein